MHTCQDDRRRRSGCYYYYYYYHRNPGSGWRWSGWRRKKVMMNVMHGKGQTNWIKFIPFVCPSQAAASATKHRATQVQVPSLDLGSSTAILMLGGYLRTRMRTGNQATRGYVLSRRDCQKCRVYRVGEPSSSCGPKGLPIETVCSLTHEEVIGISHS